MIQQGVEMKVCQDCSESVKKGNAGFAGTLLDG
jgi:hypothetical protein